MRGIGRYTANIGPRLAKGLATGLATRMATWLALAVLAWQALVPAGEADQARQAAMASGEICSAMAMPAHPADDHRPAAPGDHSSCPCCLPWVADGVAVLPEAVAVAELRWSGSRAVYALFAPSAPPQAARGPQQARAPPPMIG